MRVRRYSIPTVIAVIRGRRCRNPFCLISIGIFGSVPRLICLAGLRPSERMRRLLRLGFGA
ncbi:hypothetical protein ACMD2_13511 [Ananas comosus]|uniref:Uncharacterized protein n=1 Tax=Ananas comosus TaxID=4615 RepID=A0A199UHE5_ANACO|nr:hypothetical protein ACMD2_13511 [Ananas comosus]